MAMRSKTRAMSALVMGPSSSWLPDELQKRGLVDDLELELPGLGELGPGPGARHHQRHLLADGRGGARPRRLGFALRFGARQPLERAGEHDDLAGERLG